MFKEYFEAYSSNYVIIGGTACDLILDEAGFIPRTTKDIDIILVVEVLNSDFVKRFWQFVKDGDYRRKERSEDKRQYYRFINPGKTEFPYQLELFSRKPDLIEFEEEVHLTPIPVDDDLSSLSAILLNDDLYHYIMEHSLLQSGLHLANIEALICLKAKAYLEIAERIANGGNDDSKHLRKHKGDVFRLAVLLSEKDVFELPESIKKVMQTFITELSEDLPGKELFKTMGLGSISAETVLSRIVKSFQLEIKI